MANARGIGLGGALVLSLGLSQCVLVVSDDDVPSSGEHCRFDGETSQCGACIVEKCQPDVDQCCSDVTCSTTLGLVEACAKNADASCNSVATQTAPLASCVIQNCSGVCIERKGTSVTACEEPALSDGTSCKCKLSDTPNDFVCSDKALAETLCCAPTDWPGEGLECTCRPLGCTPTPDGCFCALLEYEPEDRTCTATSCCVEADACTCRAGPCYDWETKVSTCEVSVVGCAPGQKRVSSCSRTTLSGNQ